MSKTIKVNTLTRDEFEQVSTQEIKSNINTARKTRDSLRLLESEVRQKETKVSELKKILEELGIELAKIQGLLYAGGTA